MKRGIPIGEATAGSTGQPLIFDLPGGGTARICAKRDSYPGGREFVGNASSQLSSQPPLSPTFVPAAIGCSNVRQRRFGR